MANLRAARCAPTRQGSRADLQGVHVHSRDREPLPAPPLEHESRKTKDRHVKSTPRACGVGLLPEAEKFYLWQPLPCSPQGVSRRLSHSPTGERRFSEDFRRGNEVDTDEGLRKRDHSVEGGGGGIDPLRPEEARRVPAPSGVGESGRGTPCAATAGFSVALYPRGRFSDAIWPPCPLLTRGNRSSASVGSGWRWGAASGVRVDRGAPWQVFRAWNSRDAVAGLVCATEFPLSARSR